MAINQEVSWLDQANSLVKSNDDFFSIFLFPIGIFLLILLINVLGLFLVSKIIQKLPQQINFIRNLKRKPDSSNLMLFSSQTEEQQIQLSHLSRIFKIVLLLLIGGSICLFIAQVTLQLFQSFYLAPPYSSYFQSFLQFNLSIFNLLFINSTYFSILLFLDSNTYFFAPNIKRVFSQPKKISWNICNYFLIPIEIFGLFYLFQWVAFSDWTGFELNTSVLNLCLKIFYPICFKSDDF